MVRMNYIYYEGIPFLSETFIKQYFINKMRGLYEQNKCTLHIYDFGKMYIELYDLKIKNRWGQFKIPNFPNEYKLKFIIK